MTIKAAIFDLDGTIAAFNLDYKTVRAEARGYLMKMGVPASVISAKETIFDMLKKTELVMVKNGKPAAMEEIRKEVMQIAEKHELEAASLTSLLPGAVETLKTLRKKGLKIAVCTINGENATKKILERFRIAEFFDALISRNKVTKVKPDPEHCVAALEALGVTADETVVVGDSIEDMQAAKEIKAIGVGLTTGMSTQKQLVAQGANYVITSITDLPILIESLNKAPNTAA
ncbi:MAG: HAD family hydrolase [Candidatus Bathyarchaeota archaeon]|nr:HAD family hydrolase [Candidatus Bathyarchaeota archaeon]